MTEGLYQRRLHHDHIQDLVFHDSLKDPARRIQVEAVFGQDLVACPKLRVIEISRSNKKMKDRRELRNPSDGIKATGLNLRRQYWYVKTESAGVLGCATDVPCMCEIYKPRLLLKRPHLASHHDFTSGRNSYCIGTLRATASYYLLLSPGGIFPCLDCRSPDLWKV